MGWDCSGRVGVRSSAEVEGNDGWRVSSESRPISSVEFWRRGPGSAEREGIVEGGLSLDLRKEKKEEERVGMLAIVGDGRRVEGDCDGKELAAIERERSGSEENSRESGEDCRKRWS